MEDADPTRLWTLLSFGESSVRLVTAVARTWTELLRRVAPDLDAGDLRARFLDPFTAAVEAGDLRLQLRTALRVPPIDLPAWQLLPAATGSVLLAEGEPPLEVAALTAELSEAVLAAATHPTAARMAQLHEVEPRTGPVPQAWHSFYGLVGSSPSMRRLQDALLRAARDRQPVLISGETGAGKEVAARAIHLLMQVRGAFVPVNCAALPADLVEAELFGHARGAFTGAVRSTEGLFVEAEGGVLLLDEVTEVPLAVQTKILRVVQDGLVRAVGTTTHRRVNTRVLATTNRDPLSEVHEGTFRRDLYYRLAVHRVEIPPLREHPDDIPELIACFLQQWRADAPGVVPPRFSPEAIAALAEAPWPGNVRELQHTVFRMASTWPGFDVGREEVLSALDPDSRAAPMVFDEPSASTAAPQSLAEAERDAIVRALEATGGNKAASARLLGVTRKTLYHKLASYGIDADAMREHH